MMDQSDHAFNGTRLRELVLARCNDTLTEPGAEELSEILSTSKEARQEYLEFFAIHAQLKWEMEESSRADAIEVMPSCDALLLSQLDSAAFSSSHNRWLWWAMAACLFLAFCGGSWAWLHAEGERQLAKDSAQVRDPQLSASIVGRVTPLASQAEWSFGRPDGESKEDVRQGDTLWLKQGSVELRLTSNTTAVLESPVIMQVVSVDRVRMIDGSIKVDVPKGAEGFVVESDSAEVIDLGTSFSVKVADGNTDLIVFKGKVDLKTTSDAKGAAGHPRDITKRFYAGEAVQVTKDGTLSRIVQVRQPAEGVLSDGNELAQVTEPLIGSVEDNIERNDFWSFYEIVPKGMHEDALSFVDRPGHEWNGVTEEGMPEYLVGGDLVKTFNDDKISDDLVVKVTLTRAATVYVLIDRRVVPPEWLLESFENTGDVVGVDEAFYDRDLQRNVPEEFLRKSMVGPGNSVESTCKIWKKVMPEGGVVFLGPNGAAIDKDKGYMANANMYGLVAVPLADEE